MIIDTWNEVMIGNKHYDIHHYSEDGKEIEVTIYAVNILPNGRRETITDYWEDSFILSDDTKLLESI